MKPKVDINTEEIGQERRPVAIIDNFPFDPNSLIEEACKTQFNAPDGGFYPGNRSPAPYEYAVALADILNGNLTDTFSFNAGNIARIQPMYSFVCKKPEELHPLQKIPHFDSKDNSVLACVHYLFNDDKQFGGTSFYRHNSTGYEFITPERFNIYSSKVTDDVNKFGLPSPPQYINSSTEIFAQIKSYKAAFNRALIYRTTSLHAGDIFKDHNYSCDPLTGRFTVTSFIVLK